jgi:superfamily II DNA or RNA helicase
MSKFIRKTAFEARWEPILRNPIVENSEIFIPRPWQKECFEQIFSSGKNNIILNAPTGSGKTREMAYCIYESIQKKKKKHIISVPQIVIGEGFFERFKIGSEKSKEEWRILNNNNLCGDLTEEQKGDRFISFLEEPIKDTDKQCDLTLLCTHQTLVAIEKRLRKSMRLKLLHNTELWIDEAHHVMNNGNGITNGIGKVANYYLEHMKEGCALRFCTATLFRGDRDTIIPKKYIDDFFRYNLTYDRHFEENCGGLTFKYNFLFHSMGWMEALKEEFKRRIGKTIVFIPHPSHKVSTKYGKHKEVEQVIQIIGDGSKQWVDENDIIHVMRNGKEIKVLDIVEDNKKRRGKRLRFLKKHAEEIDVVIGINVPKEGFDWPPADRAIIIGVKNSLNEVAQTMGRLFRKFRTKTGGKNPVEFVQVFPWMDMSEMDKDQVKEYLNDFMKAVYMSLILESNMNPAIIRDIQKDKSISKSEKTEKINIYKEAIDYVQSTIGESEYPAWFERMVNNLIEFRCNNTKIKRTEYDDKYKNIIIESMAKSSLCEFQEEIADMILAELKRRTKNVMSAFRRSMKNYKNSDIDADIIMGYDPVGFIIGYTNEMCGAKVLRDFGEKNGVINGWDQTFEKVKKFKEEHKRFPDSKSSDPEEAALGVWLDRQDIALRDHKPPDLY